jgi:antitoxin HicB
MVFRVVITKEEDCYIADIPSLKHCFSGGDTIEEAIENLKEALEGTLESMQARNIPIPDDSNIIEMSINVDNNLKISPQFRNLATA